MDMEKIMAYVEKIAENLEGLVCAIGCDSMPSDGAIYGPDHAGWSRRW